MSPTWESGHHFKVNWVYACNLANLSSITGLRVFFVSTNKIIWPDGHDFGFTIFDDTDRATVENVGPIYDFLADLGMRTTKSVWPLRGHSASPGGNDTCEDPEYLAWVKRLQQKGFEIGMHLAAPTTSPREQSWAGLQKFNQIFGHWPQSLANHATCQESLYWGDYRLTGFNRILYNFLTRRKKKGRFRGHLEGDPLFWGDFCKKYVTYVRNFIFSDINTLRACPFMPYHDPARPYVNWWFASSEGNTVDSFNRTIAAKHQDRLEAEGGACIMYTHFAFGFCQNGRLNDQFKDLMERLSRKKGWFVPVTVLLDYLKDHNGGHIISNRERKFLELRWLLYKLRVRQTS
jgi:hypothetical protein